jgi:RNA polymerase sigma factor for flagellar operon FliA
VADTREIDAIWRRYHATRDQRSAERLILAYAPLVKYVAGRLGGRLPAHVDSEDLVQWGLEGLLSAITRFDPGMGNKFETFAISHIRGKMIDELRRMDFAPRSLRARAREVERAMQALEARLGRPPTDDEVAAELDVTVEDFRALLGDIARANVAALDEMWPGGSGEGDALSLLDTLEDPNAEDPTRRLGTEERRQILADGVQRLPDREKLVVTLYYFEELTLREIGEVLRVTESRVSQLHTKALLRLRGYLGTHF